MPETAAPEPTFRIGSIPVFGQLILAPMDGISDPPFRWITRRLGSALSISEFINTLDYANQKHYQVSRISFRPGERPFGVQLLDNDPVRMAECAAAILCRVSARLFRRQPGLLHSQRHLARRRRRHDAHTRKSGAGFRSWAKRCPCP
jgi:hypothetical protein